MIAKQNTLSLQYNNENSNNLLNTDEMLLNITK